MRILNFKKIALVILLCIVLSGCSFSASSKYEKAQLLLAKGNYEQAIDIFTELGNYEDANLFVMYAKTILSAEEGYFEAAIKSFSALEDFQDSKLRAVYYSARQKEAELQYDLAEEIYNTILMFLDSNERATKCPELKKEAYDRAMDLSKNSEYTEAIHIYTILGDYLDATNQIEYCKKEIWKGETYIKACNLQTSQNYEEAIRLFSTLEGYSDSQEQIETCQEAIYKRGYDHAIDLFKKEKYEEALEEFKNLGDFSDSIEKVITCKEKIKERDYAAALEYLENGRISDAYELLISVGNYKDAHSLLNTDEKLIGARKTKAYRIIGNTVELGKYRITSKRDTIEWIVLDYDSILNQALLVSTHSLIRMGHKLMYTREYPTWEKSNIRQWLNYQFLTSTFSYSEQSCIVTKDIITPDYADGSGGPITKDKIFVLSRKEADVYFLNDSSRKAYIASEYYNDIDYGGKIHFAKLLPWWLRDPGRDGWECSYVSEYGDICDNGFAYAMYGVRPALYLDLTAYAKLID